jgi:hypothetical protein
MTKDNLLEELIQSNYKAKTGTNFNKTIFEIFTSKLCKIYDDKTSVGNGTVKKIKKVTEFFVLVENTFKHIE